MTNRTYIVNIKADDIIDLETALKDIEDWQLLEKYENCYYGYNIYRVKFEDIDYPDLVDTLDLKYRYMYDYEFIN